MTFEGIACGRHKRVEKCGKKLQEWDGEKGGLRGSPLLHYVGIPGAFPSRVRFRPKGYRARLSDLNRPSGFSFRKGKIGCIDADCSCHSPICEVWAGQPPSGRRCARTASRPRSPSELTVAALLDFYRACIVIISNRMTFTRTRTAYMYLCAEFLFCCFCRTMATVDIRNIVIR